MKFEKDEWVHCRPGPTNDAPRGDGQIIALPATHLGKFIVQVMGCDFVYAKDELIHIPCTTHQSPIGKDLVTPCCGRSPFELPRSDRLTLDAKSVDCGVDLKPYLDMIEAEIESIAEAAGLHPNILRRAL